VVAGPDPGHAFPAAGLAVRLRGAGCDVLVVTGPRWLPALARDGLAAAALPLLDPHPDDADFGFRLWGRGAQMARPTADVLAAWRPDAVVTDTLTVCGGFAAALLGVPYAELLPHPLQDLSRHAPPMGLGLAPGTGPAGRTRDAVLRALARRSLRQAAHQRAAALRAVGLADARPRVRLVAALPVLELPRPDWPADAHLVGPLEWDPADGLLEPPPGDAPLVLLSGSTATGSGGDLLAAALAGLSGVRLACTRLTPYDGELPSWAVAGPGRQAPLLERASVVVCGGGHGMLAKALGCGIPVVTLPGPGDQRENAARVRRLGAGVVLEPARLTPAALAAAVATVLAVPSYREAARRAAVQPAGEDPESVLAAAFG